MATVPANVTWMAPASRVAGDRLLKQRQRIAVVAKEAEQQAVIIQAEKHLEQRVKELETLLERLIGDLPKIVPGGGGGKRMVAKVLQRDFPEFFIELLPAAAPLTGDEYVHILQNGEHVRTTINAIAAVVAYGTMDFTTAGHSGLVVLLEDV